MQVENNNQPGRPKCQKPLVIEIQDDVMVPQTKEEL